jgi:hypothetical protein
MVVLENYLIDFNADYRNGSTHEIWTTTNSDGHNNDLRWKEVSTVLLSNVSVSMIRYYHMQRY